MTTPTIYYRYNDYADTVHLEEFPVVKETPHGVWLHAPYYTKSGKKFVRLSSWDGPAFKRWAHPTKEEAEVSFFARKQKQLQILHHRIATIQAAVHYLKTGCPTPDPFDIWSAP